MSEAKVLTGLSKSEARSLPAGSVVDLGSGTLAEDARSIIEMRRLTLLRHGRVIVQAGNYLPAAFDDAPAPDQEVRCPACSELILASAHKCKHCGEWFTPAAALAGAERETSRSNMMAAGAISCALGGLLILGSLVMDTSVSLDAGRRVHNLGLLNLQQNALILGGVLLVAGVILVVAGRRT
jgi:hypothetical protein